MERCLGYIWRNTNGTHGKSTAGQTTRESRIPTLAPLPPWNVLSRLSVGRTFIVSFWMNAGRRCCNARIHPTKDSSRGKRLKKEGGQGDKGSSPGMDFPTPRCLGRIEWRRSAQLVRVCSTNPHRSPDHLLQTARTSYPITDLLRASQAVGAISGATAKRVSNSPRCIHTLAASTHLAAFSPALSTPVHRPLQVAKAPLSSRLYPPAFRYLAYRNSHEGRTRHAALTPSLSPSHYCLRPSLLSLRCIGQLLPLGCYDSGLSLTNLLLGTKPRSDHPPQLIPDAAANRVHITLLDNI